jgi:hypothetical protein
VATVRAGEFPEAAIDRKVRRLLVFAARVGALEGFGPRGAATHSCRGQNCYCPWGLPPLVRYGPATKAVLLPLGPRSE